MIAFGPVPSRRLGRSLGINHVPPKVCSYSCVYCQVGRTNRLRVRRCTFMEPGRVVGAVKATLEVLRDSGGSIDYVSFVPDGEPTLDQGLGEMIQGLKPLGIPIAVITNSSLLARPDVRRALAAADWVSLKIDSVDAARWREVNRPHGRLRLDAILAGMRLFAAEFRGRLVTETMLVAGVNDAEDQLRATARFVQGLRPATAYVAVPIRPPAEPRVAPPTSAAVTRAYEVFRGLVGQVELLVGYEGDAFASTGDPHEDLLAITAVHPMRDHAVDAFLRRAGASRSLAAEMVERGELVETTYGGHHYLLRSIPKLRSTVARH